MRAQNIYVGMRIVLPSFSVKRSTVIQAVMYPMTEQQTSRIVTLPRTPGELLRLPVALVRNLDGGELVYRIAALGVGLMLVVTALQ